MKHQKLAILSAALLIWSAAPTFVAAQPGGMPGRGPISFAEYDTDGDGLVSEEEFYAARGARMAARAEEGRQMRNAPEAPAFEEFDSDGDGFLTAEELQSGQRALMEKRMAEREAMGMPGRPGGGPGMAGGRGPGMGPGGPGGPRGGMGREMPTFDDIDLDGDGVITREEFEQHHAQMRGQR